MIDSEPSLSGEFEGFEIVREIGHGSFARVYLARDKLSDISVALKVIPKKLLDNPKRIAAYHREIYVLKKANNPFISGYYYNFETEENYIIVMEYLPNGNLLDHINDTGGLNEYSARKFFAQLVVAIEYLHDTLKIVHRDLKAENILLDENNNIRLIDFGLSNILEDSSTEFASPCGSSCYTAPEMFVDHRYTSSVDIWSLGILLYAMTVGNLPFEDDNWVTLCTKITTKSPFYPIQLSSTLVDLIKKLLIKNPAARATFRSITSHPWFPSAEYRVMKTLVSVVSLPLDDAILHEMEKLGIDHSNLEAEMGSATRNECVYRELVYTKAASMMKHMMAGRPGNSAARRMTEDTPTRQRRSHRFSISDEDMKPPNGRTVPRIAARRASNSGAVMSRATEQILNFI